MMTQRAPYVGVTVSKFEGYMPSTLIRGLKLLGLDFIEVNMSLFPEIDQVAARLGNMITSFHLPLIGEEGWDLSCLDYKDEIEATINTLKAYKDKLHIQYVVCHPPEPGEASRPLNSSIEFLFENLKKLHMPVHLENVPSINPDEFLGIYWQAEKALGKQLSGICFDAPHFFITGHDPIEQYKTFNDSISSIHLSDCLPDKDEHIPFNSGGALPVHEFLQTVHDANFSNYIILEIRPQSLKELDSYINSYLTTLQYVNTKKYLTSKLRIMALRPLIKRFAA